MNKATEVRKALGLTQKEAGELFAGQAGQNASDTWGRWERTEKWPKPADKLMTLILALKVAESLKTPGVSKGLEFALNELREK